MYKIVESVNNEMRITTSIKEEEFNELKKLVNPYGRLMGK